MPGSRLLAAHLSPNLPLPAAIRNLAANERGRQELASDPTTMPALLRALSGTGQVQGAGHHSGGVKPASGGEDTAQHSSLPPLAPSPALSMRLQAIQVSQAKELRPAPRRDGDGGLGAVRIS